MLRSTTAAALLALAPARAWTQAPALGASVVVSGVVQDSAARPISDVQVRVLGTPARAFSDTAGRYRVVAAGQGDSASLEYRRFGFRPETVTVALRGGLPNAVVTRDQVLWPVAQALAAVEVNEANGMASRYRRRVERILARYEASPARFITREEIERRRPAFITELLARRPAVLVTRRADGTGVVRLQQKNPYAAWQRGCRIQYFVDGVGPWFVEQMPRGLDAWGPDEIQTVEVYRWPEETPEEYRTPSAHCGVIALWTREGR
jgi:hypothetical protein